MLISWKKASELHLASRSGTLKKLLEIFILIRECTCGAGAVAVAVYPTLFGQTTVATGYRKSIRSARPPGLPLARSASSTSDIQVGGVADDGNATSCSTRPPPPRQVFRSFSSVTGAFLFCSVVVRFCKWCVSICSILSGSFSSSYVPHNIVPYFFYVASVSCVLSRTCIASYRYVVYLALFSICDSIGVIGSESCCRDHRVSSCVFFDRVVLRLPLPKTDVEYYILSTI